MNKALALLAVLALATLTGCVQRTISITSSPAEALVYLNDTEVGRTPLKVPFTFYGTYDVRLIKEGYETLHQPTEAKAPWWEAPGPDLIAEALPGDQHVKLEWHFEMNELTKVDPESLIKRAQELRGTFENGSTASEPADEK